MKIGVIGIGWLGKALSIYLSKDYEIVLFNRTNRMENLFDFENIDLNNAELPFINNLCDLYILCTPPNCDLELAKRQCKNVLNLIQNKPLIYTSSTSIYNERNQVCTENHALNQNSILCVYEQLLNSRENTTILRLAGLVGPNRYPAVFMSSSRKIYAGNEPVNLIHQDDVIRLIDFVIKNKIYDKIINGCSSEHPLKSIFYTFQAEKLGINPPIFSLENDSTSQKVISNAYSISLGFEYKYQSPFDFPII